MRWTNIGMRTAHIATASVLFGGVMLGQAHPVPYTWHHWMLASGLGLLALEWLNDRRWPHRGKGLLVQAHIFLALGVHLWPEYRVALLWAILVSGCVGSHMPRRFRHWSFLDGREKREGRDSRPS